MSTQRWRLKGRDSYDLPDGQSLPPDPANCSITINASVGSSDGNDADLFQFTFVTPAWLASNADPWIALRYTVVVQEFSWEIVDQALTELIGGLKASSWDEFATQMSRFGAWEFEGITNA